MSADEVQIDPERWHEIAAFNYVGGKGGEARQDACVMTAISWVTGTKWTDHPEFIHKQIIPIVIRANDAAGTTPEDRAGMIELAAAGALNTAHLPDSVIEGVVKRYEGQEPLPRALNTLKWLVGYQERIKREEVPSEADFVV